MAESYSVKAILSAQDRGFKSVFGAATKSAKDLKSTLMGGVGFGAMMAIGQKAVSAVSGSLSGLTKETINTSDAMQKLQQAMRFSGYAEDEIQRIAGATGTLKTYADKTVFSLQDVMSTFGSLSANGVQDADRLTEAVGNAVAVFGGGAQEFSSVALAFSQAMASGALHAEDWNQIVNASPQLAGGLRKELIKLNPILGEDFKGAMKDGAITADLLGQAMNNIGMTDMAKEAAQSVTTFEGAMGNLEATVTNGLLNLYDSFAKTKVVDAINGFNQKIGKGFEWLATEIPNVISKVSPYWEIFKSSLSEVKTAFGDAFSAIGRDLGKVTGAFGSTESISSFAGTMDSASGALQTFAGFLEDHSEVIAKVIPQIPKLVVAYKGFKIAKSVAPFVGAFTSAIVGLAGAGISKIAGKLFGISKGQEAVGKSSASSSKKMMASAKSFMMLGTGVALISAGFFLLAQGAKAVADSGPLAVGVLAGLVAVVAGLGLGMMKMLSSMSGGTKKLAAMSKAMIAFGASLLMVSAAFYVLSSAAINLASAGPLAIGVMVGMVAAIAGLMIVAKMVGPALTAGAVGLLAFGAAVLVAAAGMMLLTTASISLANAGPLAVGVMFGLIVAIGALMVVAAAVGPALTAASIGLVAFGAAALLVGVGALLAGVALAVVAAVLPIVTTYGIEGATAILQLSLAMMAFAAGTTLAGAGCIILGAGLMVVGAGLALVGAAVIVTAAGMMLLAAGTLVLGAGLSLVASTIMVVAVALPLVAAGALLGVAGFTALMAVSVALGASMLLLTTSFTLLAALSLAATVGITAFGVAMVAGSVGTLAMAAALLSVNSSMKSISKNAKSAQKSITSMKDSVSIVNDGLDALGNKAKSAVNSLVSAFNDGAGRARNAGQKMGDGVKDGVTKGLQPLPNIANQTMSRFNSALSSGASRAIATVNMMSVSIVAALSSAAPGAYSSGLSIGINFANGLAASLGRIQSIAAQMSAAASSAAAARASMPKTRSIIPAETVMEPMAATYSLTYAMDDIADIPTIASVETARNMHASSLTRSIEDEYSYRPHKDEERVIIIPVNLDGREIARVTAPYTREEMDRIDKKGKLIRGIR